MFQKTVKDIKKFQQFWVQGGSYIALHCKKIGKDGSSNNRVLLKKPKSKKCIISETKKDIKKIQRIKTPRAKAIFCKLFTKISELFFSGTEYCKYG